jgi:phosphohistidine phosphatase
MRHAKSSWENSDFSDFERPLNEIGLKAAPFMGNIIYQNGLQPDLIVSSPAKRAKQTAVLIKAVAEIKAQIEYREELYGAKPTAFFEVTAAIEDKFESVLLIGHNPELENFIHKLTRENQSMPTTSIAVIRLNIESWSEIAFDSGRLELVLRPKDLMERIEIESVYQSV